jgi:hypothetical protein
MPQLIETIDAIARQKQRDVLFVMFKPSEPLATDSEQTSLHTRWDWEQDPLRQQVCQWLTQQQIAWQLCMLIADEHCIMGYQGAVYIDVPFDEADPQYQQVQQYLELPDGRMRYPSVTFYYLPLSRALENAHHDEPGFWEQWAKAF